VQNAENIKIDLLLCCGDFQAVRNEEDLECMATPKKYRTMNSFYKYYSGELQAPVLTIFIGGNHEASNHLWELFHGGWVCPNIYYLGHAGVVNFGGIRIGGLSGIFKDHHYKLGHFERPPYSENDMRSAYHIREYDIFRLMQIRRPVDIFLSHDWPTGIAHFGNKEQLFRMKPFLREEVESGSLGSPPAEQLLKHLQPRYWFSAHLHVKYAATVQHPVNGTSPRTTRFLSLDKCLPRRDFLQVMDVEPMEIAPPTLTYDEEWLAILKSTYPLLSISKYSARLPRPGNNDRIDYGASQEEIKFVRQRLAQSSHGIEIPDNFAQTAPLYNPSQHKSFQQPKPRQSPQTDALLSLLELPNVFFPNSSSTSLRPSPSLSHPSAVQSSQSSSSYSKSSSPLAATSSASTSSLSYSSSSSLVGTASSSQDRSPQTSSTTTGGSRRLALPPPKNTSTASTTWSMLDKELLPQGPEEKTSPEQS